MICDVVIICVFIFSYFDDFYFWYCVCHVIMIE